MNLVVSGTAGGDEPLVTWLTCLTFACYPNGWTLRALWLCPLLRRDTDQVSASPTLYTIRMLAPDKEVVFQGLHRAEDSSMLGIVYREIDGPRLVAIGIGPNDAWKIMGVVQEKQIRQNMGANYDTALSFYYFIGELMKALQAKLDRLLITGYDGAMWKSTMYLTTPEGAKELVCRASDGAAIAFAAECPVFATNEALNMQPV